MPGVCPSVCRSVCSQLDVKTTERIFTKILPQVYLCTRNNGLNFGSHPAADLDPGMFLNDSATERVIGFS